MSGLVGFVLKYLWVAMIALIAFNAWSWRRTGRALTAWTPDIAERYRDMTIHFFVWAAAPWIAMGIGILSGDAHDALDFLHPAHGQWSVILFYVMGFLATVYSGIWLFALGGVQALIDHPGFFHPAGFFNSPGVLRGFYTVWAIFFILIVLVLVLFDPVPG